MSHFSEYKIGRENVDIILSDTGVSRLHAEMVVSADGRFYITDCNSKSGTYVYRNDNWIEIQQDFIDPREKITMGRRSYTPMELMSMAPQGRGGGRSHVAVAASAPALKGKGPSGGGGVPDPKDDLPAGQIKRNPLTGEVESDD